MSQIHRQQLQRFGYRRKFDPAVTAAVDAVFHAAAAIERVAKNAKVKAKEGPRAIVTRADEESERVIFSRITKEFPRAKIIAEEKISHPAALSWKKPVGILDKGIRFVADPVDGTTLFAHRLSNWSIGIGTIKDGEILGGAVFAPTTNEGLLVFAEKGKGAFSQEGSGAVKQIPRLKQSQPEPKASVVMIGVDIPLYRNALDAVATIARNVQGLYTTGSSLLALAFVATGRISAVTQPPQKPWDWVPAYQAVIETGNIFKFYRLGKGIIIPVEKIDIRAFTAPRETNGLGFIAGRPAIVRRIWDILPKSGWPEMSPDTIAGNW